MWTALNALFDLFSYKDIDHPIPGSSEKQTVSFLLKTKKVGANCEQVDALLRILERAALEAKDILEW